MFKKKQLYALLGIAVIASALGITGYLHLGGPPWLWPARALIRHDPPQRADAILVLMGNVVSRTPKAIELYQQGVAKKIIFCRTISTKAETLGIRMNDGEGTEKLLLDAEIPPEHITYLRHKEVSSTIEEAQVLLLHLKKEKDKANANTQASHQRLMRLVIVTDWYHTSRAGWIFEKMNHPGFELHFAAARSEGNDPDSWYQFESSFLATFTEYLKWLYYLTHY